MAALLLRRRKPAGANTPVAPVSPGIPTGKAPGADASKTVAVRGAGTIPGQGAAELHATWDNGKTVRVRGEGRQITSFASSLASTVEVMHFDCVLSDGQQLRAELECPVDFIIGREPGSSLVLPDSSVSGQHARITCSEAEVTLESISPLRDSQLSRLCVDRQEIGGPTRLRSGTPDRGRRCRHRDLAGAPARRRGRDPARPRRRYPAGPISLPEVSWTLEDGRQGRQAVKLAGQVTIGRDSGDAVTIPDPAVSRSHLIVNRGPEGLVVRNGSLAKGERKNPFYCGSQAVYDQPLPVEDIYAGGAAIRLRLAQSFAFHTMQKGRDPWPFATWRDPTTRPTSSGRSTRC